MKYSIIFFVLNMLLAFTIAFSTDNNKIKAINIVELSTANHDFNNIFCKSITIEFDTLQNAKSIQQFMIDSNIVIRYKLLPNNGDSSENNKYEKIIFSIDNRTYDSSICFVSNIPYKNMTDYKLDTNIINEYFPLLDNSITNGSFINGHYFNKYGLIDTYNIIEIPDTSTNPIKSKRRMFYYKFY